MIKEKYEKPIMEVVDLKDDVILTSGGSSPYCPNDCSTDASCFKFGNYYIWEEGIGETWVNC